ncbi:hypothetical protein [Prauserella endophytica]|uniref:Uncharacterized protein n=1 Tax=Prauserella endophytica TaxID=1592324 RepID=A0ABY2S6B1_9PSEU|nr:hypothetical protein [Prauserella endophytica]TKG70572.1 hypothetical protein FCN18_16975 [Prauserella endophytica]
MARNPRVGSPERGWPFSVAPVVVPALLPGEAVVRVQACGVLGPRHDRALPSLPDDAVVRTGHGDQTSIGEEVPELSEWISRGY